MKTVFLKPKDVRKKWYLIDAQDKILGRIASKVALILRGKNKPYYVPHQDMGDNVIIINSSKVKLSGKKFLNKMYYRHSGYPGGLYSQNYKTLVEKKPTEPLKKAIKGMLPKGPLGRKLLSNLRIFENDSHNLIAQKPEKIEI